MKFLNRSSSFYQQEMCMAATLEQVGAWFKLDSYCTQQMNGGKIVNCKEWPAGFWANIGVPKELVMEESPLWHFSGLVLVVHAYDKIAEEKYRHRRAYSKRNAEARWKKNRNGSHPEA